MTRSPTARPKETAASRPDRRSEETDRSWARPFTTKRPSNLAFAEKRAGRHNDRIFLHEVESVELPRARHGTAFYRQGNACFRDFQGPVLLMLSEMHITGGRRKRNDHEASSRARLTWVNATIWASRLLGEQHH